MVRSNRQRIFCNSSLFRSAERGAFFLITLMMLMMIWRIMTMTGPMIVGIIIAKKMEEMPKFAAILSLTEHGTSIFLLRICSVRIP